MSNSGFLVVVTAPSGSGKTTIYREVLRKNPELVFSVSYTTRKRRPSEIHGRDYYFIDRKTFDRMAADGKFIEWAVVHGELKGTERAQVERCLMKMKVCILDVDVQGALNIMNEYPDAVTIFIEPPSIEELEKRLRKRKTESEEQILVRLRDAENELAYRNRFKYIVVNDIAENAIRKVEEIITQERKARS
ncbi:MAG: guanylate kinase [Spirochaetes bacterium]|nr:guanylate kinase [Spirochaetota bacterium]